MPKAWRADSPLQLHNVYRAARAVMGDDALMLQELIPGGGQQQLSLAAVCRRGDGHLGLRIPGQRLPTALGLAHSGERVRPESHPPDPARRLLEPDAVVPGRVDLT